MNGNRYGSRGRSVGGGDDRDPPRRRRAMPVGGVIGGADAWDDDPSVTGRPRRRGEDNRPEFDPDDPWRVEEGVPPVIEPSTQQTHHDPGPGVIGIDR